MINPSIEELLMKAENRYTLVIITAKRARQLIKGANKVIECDSKKPVTIAANEVNENKIVYVKTKVGIK